MNPIDDANVLVQVDAISRTFGTTQAVRDVSFVIRKGEVLGFLGPNGAGKSTTMQIVTGNLAPSSGRVRVLGHDLRDEPVAAKRALGYLPEYPPLYRELTVDEYLDYCAQLHRIPRRQRRAVRDAAKAKCSLSEVGHRLIGNLSKGYQQRVGLAQAILHDPQVIILDEPTVGLDPIQIREIRELIRALGREHAIILSTHILSEVQATCDRVQIINKGQLVLNDTIENLAHRLQSRALSVAFRGKPEIAQIRRLAGVTEVKEDADGRVHIYHNPDIDPTEAVIALAADQQWGLYEINAQRASLEEIFVELTQTEQAAKASA